MNSDHVQRYHIRQDGVVIKTPNGEWILFNDAEQLLDNNIILNSDQQKALMKLGLELIKLDGKHKNFNNAKAISLIVEIVKNHKFKEE